MKQTILFSLFLFISCTQTFAQKESNIWAFGGKVGIDFNSGNPVAITTNINTQEGNASICDPATGQLLFYTDGSNVYDRNNNLMPNGANLQPYFANTNQSTSSCAQAAVIVPIDCEKYYIFSLAGLGTDLAFGTVYGTKDAGKLFYSVVDMTVNGGLGGVVAGQKAIILDSMLCEKMTTVEGTNGRVWLVVRGSDASHARNFNSIRAFEITATGVNHTPVISTIGFTPTFPSGIYQGAIGQFAFAPNKKTLAETYLRDNLFALYDFDGATGVVSNYIPITTADATYAACFSPNGTKLYIAAMRSQAQYNGATNQYDVTSGNATTIAASRYRLFTNSISPLKLASDGKIYFGNPAVLGGGVHIIGRIESPDLAGAACTPNSNVLQVVQTGTIGTFLGFPNALSYVKQVGKDTSRKAINMIACLKDSLVLQANVAGFNYDWDNGVATSTRTIYQPGRYIVKYESIGTCGKNKYNIDTFVVTKWVPSVAITGACLLGKGTVRVIIQAGDTATATYTWRDASNATIKTHQSKNGDTLLNAALGQYTLRIQRGPCDTILQLTVPLTHPPVVAATITGTCKTGQTGKVVVTLPTADTSTLTYQWTDPLGNVIATHQSKNGDVITNLGTGKHTLLVKGACDTVVELNIPVAPSPKVLIENITASCRNGRTGTATVTLPTADTSTLIYQWMDSLGNIIATHQGKNGDVINSLGSGKHTLLIKGVCDTIIELNVPVVPAPKVSVNVSGSCATETNGRAWVIPSGTSGNTTYEWRDAGNTIIKTGQGAMGETLENVAPGTYSVRVQADCDTIVNVIVPELPAPNAMFDVDTNVCIMHPVVFTNATQDILTWSWNFGDKNASTERDPQHIYTMVGDYVVTLDVRNENCPGTTIKTIHVYDFKLELTVDKAIVRMNDMVTLQSSSTSQYEVLAWLPAELFSDQTAKAQSISVNKKVPYLVVGKSDYGCIDTATATVNIKAKMELPTAFSPNSDGKNDNFRPLFLFGTMDVEYFRIYDRWGKQVWSAIANEAKKGWDGTYAGTPADLGVYFYMIKAIDIDGEIIESKGDVTLMR